MNHSLCIRLKAMPLRQQIEGRDDKRHAGTEVIGPPVMLMLQVTDRRQHREDRFNHHAGIPRATFADFHIGRIAGAAMKAGIGQTTICSENDKSRNQSVIWTALRLQSQAPGNDDWHKPISRRASAQFEFALSPKKLRELRLLARMDQFDTIRVGHPQQTRLGQNNPSTPDAPSGAKQARPFGKWGTGR
jgi:hypothetical protein